MQKVFLSSLQFMAVALAVGFLAPTDLMAQSSSRSAAPMATGSAIQNSMQQSVQTMSQGAAMPSVLGDSSIQGSSNMMQGEVIVSDPSTSYSAPMTSYAAPATSYAAPTTTYAAPMASSSSPCCGTAPVVTYSAPANACCPSGGTSRGLFGRLRGRR